MGDHFPTPHSPAALSPEPHCGNSRPHLLSGSPPPGSYVFPVPGPPPQRNDVHIYSCCRVCFWREPKLSHVPWPLNTTENVTALTLLQPTRLSISTMEPSSHIAQVNLNFSFTLSPMSSLSAKSTSSSFKISPRSVPFLLPPPV